MCGRMGVDFDRRQILDGFPGLFADPADLDESLAEIRRGEIRPTDRVLVARWTDGAPRTFAAFWTLVPPWYAREVEWATTRTGTRALRLPPGRKVHFNSRFDTLTGSPGWIRLLATGRCVAFASSYTEWSDVESLPKGAPKRRARFRLKERPVMAFAGVAHAIVGPSGETLQTFSVITTEPNDMMRALPHHRMPAILPPEDVDPWLSGALDPARAIRPTADEEMSSSEEAKP